MAEPGTPRRRLTPATFLSDLSASWNILWRAPSIIAVTLLLHAVVAANVAATTIGRQSDRTCLVGDSVGSCPPRPWIALVALIYLPVSIFIVGFVGTQRVWFMRAKTGSSLKGREVWRMSWNFFGRYLVLGILSVPILVLGALPTIMHRVQAPGEPVHYGILFYVAVFVVDVLATFVSPALALSTRRVRVAIPAGIRMLIRTWPDSFWYAAAPPLTFLALGVNAVRNSLGLASAVIIAGVVAPLIGLWTKSATVLFYLRHAPAIGPDGAAYLSRNTCPNGHAVEKHSFFCAECGAELRPH